MKSMKSKKALLLAALALWAPLMMGCVYAHNYDENGNEMSQEQVEEAVQNIQESVEDEIRRAISEDDESE